MTETTLVSPSVSASTTVQTASIKPQDFDLERELAKLSKDEKKQVMQIKEQIELDNTNEIVGFGTDAQKDIALFSDGVLENIRSKDSGYVGKEMTDLLMKLDDLSIGDLGEPNALKRLPVVGKLFDSTKRFLAKYDTLEGQISKIVSNLEAGQHQMLKDIALLDNLYDRNQDFIKRISMIVLAGEMKVSEYEEKVLPALKKKADASDDIMEAQHYSNVKNLVSNFKKRLHDLNITRIVSIQTGPQIKLVQSNDRILVEKLNTIMGNTIPLWKRQVVLAIALMKQSEVLEGKKAVDRMTEQLLTENSKRVKQQSIAVAQENEKGLISLDTLKQVNNDLIETIDTTLKIQEDGRRARLQAERELLQIEGQLKSRLKKSVV